VATPDLEVPGLHALRVVASSVIPSLPSANSCATTLMIAERAAD
jgi:choline dehydrogenase